ncbi:GNAT family N-acetyltransferase [Roseicyclus mahoneyensis]|uniref:RimJ/RimL family protein N-acetyltransferase n=1 Tax=Roseicyclus mahoneyensis TaxID=164332 RepID=A0A316GLM6_9RHOB|nr:GNAT family N-acetyltransferase [Roseicyclus mahoneyensis]PWK60829.1 RimJ/RimL family protein N-acetyltransferase [Roseicyclus mahoneyensis]
MQAPTLQTARLTLRPMRETDFPSYAALMAGPRSIYMGGPFDTGAAWGLFCHDVACWALFGHGALMLERHDTGETVGQVGLNAGPLFPETELGWMVYDGHARQGFATEGAAALRDWAWDALPLDSLVSYTHPDNAASQAVARRLGAVEDGDAPRQDAEDIVFRHWRAA